jgi:hypothetical protein
MWQKPVMPHMRKKIASVGLSAGHGPGQILSTCFRGLSPSNHDLDLQRG